jgi:folylpolyglutamate synthase/dihydrofolate synthase
MTVEETFEYIRSVKWMGSKPGLSRTRELLDALGNPQKSLKFIHVAGTNGKGSTCAMLDSVLRASGYRVGMHTSPYIARFNECLRVNGELITDEELTELVGTVRPHADAMVDKPTEFELITCLAMLYFKQKACDIVVLEVGLGGELDSTNVIDTPELAVIAAIGLDHTAFLGNTIELIASAKAGIIKPGGDVVVYGAEPDALPVFKRKCSEVGARLTLVDFGRLCVRELTLDGSVSDFLPYKELQIPLAGAYQPRNMALTVTAAEVLRLKGWNITDGTLRQGLAQVAWPGRFELIRRNPTVILDGAHNGHGIAAACDGFRTLFPGQKLVFLVGVMADKDVRSMMTQLAEFAAAFVAVTPHNDRALDAELLAELLRSLGKPVTACGSIDEGVREALRLAKELNAPLAALGSLYFSADVRRAFSSNS